MNPKRFGYPTDEPCQVCGSRENVQTEPRFGYKFCPVCESRYTAVEIGEMIANKNIQQKG